MEFKITRHKTADRHWIVCESTENKTIVTIENFDDTNIIGHSLSELPNGAHVTITLETKNDDWIDSKKKFPS